ncbi:atpase h -transporting v1 subunit e1a-related [Anaeramoeba ignava]|uniref:Atpase h -transporting v1 subunit e1a-related n=1 Tax=Anaeramoeba ignava TaxID=1746090 RepID=A0A9Q0LBB3_ANAIG|nr:atpase h -transporting v1 subunit e1a-related [Anaeramoeba ignava]
MKQEKNKQEKNQEEKKQKQKKRAKLTDQEVVETFERMIEQIDNQRKERLEKQKKDAENLFKVEKRNLMNQEFQLVDDEYERKKKKILAEKKIQNSTIINSTRLAILKAKYNAVQRILKEAHFKLTEIGKPSPQYEQLIEKLIIQGLLKLREPKVILQCRHCDVKIVNEAIPKAIEKYKEITSKDCEIKLLRSQYLPPPKQKGKSVPFCSGGVVLNSSNGRIVCSNTLDNRLLMAFESILPLIRDKLFEEVEEKSNQNN